MNSQQILGSVFGINQLRMNGGPGSGNFGHEGRPGEVGGSGGEGGGSGKSDSWSKRENPNAPSDSEYAKGNKDTIDKMAASPGENTEKNTNSLNSSIKSLEYILSNHPDKRGELEPHIKKGKELLDKMKSTSSHPSDKAGKAIAEKAYSESVKYSEKGAGSKHGDPNIAQNYFEEGYLHGIERGEKDMDSTIKRSIAGDKSEDEPGAWKPAHERQAAEAFRAGVKAALKKK